jgi:hypothetical protein
MLAREVEFRCLIREPRMETGIDMLVQSTNNYVFLACSRPPEQTRQGRILAIYIYSVYSFNLES